MVVVYEFAFSNSLFSFSMPYLKRDFAVVTGISRISAISTKLLLPCM